MTTACGLDFGTSNSAIGILPDGVPTLAALENGAPLFPSAIFFDFEQNRPLFGTEAIETYMAQVDGRLMRALKSILATPLVKESTLLKTQRITFEAVIGLFVAEMKARGEAALGRPIDAVVHGRPVHFVDGDEAADRFAEDTLKVIAESKGFRGSDDATGDADGGSCKLAVTYGSSACNRCMSARCCGVVTAGSMRLKRRAAASRPFAASAGRIRCTRRSPF
mgnify:CR=1 FL=1